MIDKHLLVNFKSNKFTALIFITVGMWKWEYNIFTLPLDYKINDHVKIWVEAKFGICMYCGKEDIMFLICCMTLREDVIRESCDFTCVFLLP